VLAVLHGLGGMGKTRLALEYAWRHAGTYGALLLVDADSPEALQRNLAPSPAHPAQPAGPA
jgi:muconolactone delta-isomerase